MKTNLSCPNCSYEFEISELMRTQVASQIRAELEEESTSRRAQLESERQEIARQRMELKAQREALADEVQTQVERERNNLLERAKKQERRGIVKSRVLE